MRICDVLLNFFISVYMLAFLCRIPFNPYFTELYISFFIWLKTPPLLLQIQVIPGFIRIISYLLPNYNLSEWHAHCCFWVAFQHKSRISPLDVPLIPHPTSCMHLVAHNHACPFLFSESRIFRPKIQGNTRFSQDSYTHPFFLSTATQYFWPEKPHTNPCLTSIIINFNVSFPPILFFFFTSVTRISPYTSTL